MALKEFIAVRNDTPQEIIDSLAGPLEGHEELIIMEDDWQLENLWVAAGKFPSLSQARKNNHGGPIPDGYTDYPPRKKSKGVWLTILNIGPLTVWDVLGDFMEFLWQTPLEEIKRRNSGFADCLKKAKLVEPKTIKQRVPRIRPERTVTASIHAEMRGKIKEPEAPQAETSNVIPMANYRPAKSVKTEATKPANNNDEPLSYQQALQNWRSFMSSGSATPSSLK